MANTYDVYARYYDSLWQDLTEDVSFYCQYADKIGGPVLELGAGTGRISLPIARAGRSVTALEQSAAMLDVFQSKLRLLPADANVRLVHGDMRTFQLRQRFDLIILAFRGFLHLLTVEDQLACLQAIRAHLSERGQAVINFFNPDPLFMAEYLKKSGYPMMYLGAFSCGEQNIHYYSTTEYDLANQLARVQFIFHTLSPDGKVKLTEISRFIMRLVYRYEMEHLVARAGLRVKRLYGSFMQDELSNRHNEMIWVLERGEA